MKLLTQWAFTSSALILIVLAVRVLFRNKLSARLRYALWGVVLLRLLVPFQVELPASVSDSVPLLVSNAVPEVEQWEERTIPVFPERSKPVAEFDLDIETTLEPGEILSYSDKAGGQQRSADGETIIWYRYLLSPEQIVLALWLAGAVLTGTVILLSNLGFARRLRKRRERIPAGVQCPPLQDAPIPVYVAEGLPSPCLFGVLRPAVYVTPQAAEDPDTLRHVLAHELTHYAHKDHFWSLLRCFSLALHWYDPLVWLAVVLSKQDGELACDEGAVARLGEEERIPYGRTLVDMVAARSLRPGDLLSCSTAMTGGGKSVKQRVAQIVKKPETVKAALFAVIALVALGLVFTFAGRAQPQPSTMFLSLLEQTTAIRYIPTVYDSRAYPEAITDEDLLAQTKELLSTFTYLSEDEPYPDLSGLAPHQDPKIVLICGEQETEYTLMWQNNYTYLFLGDLWEQQEALKKEEGETAKLQGVSGTMRSRPGDRVFSALADLSCQQLAKAKPASPELEAFLADLDNASSIRYYPPLYSSTLFLDPIAEEDLLAEAKDALSGFRYLEDGDPQPDLRETLHQSRITLTFEGGEMGYSLLWQNDYTYLFPGNIWRQAMDLKEEEGETAQLLGVSGTCISTKGNNVISTIRRLAGGQARLLMDPMPMLQSELEEYTRKLLREGDTPLLGRPGGAGGLEFHYGYTSGDSLWLWYWGDKEHDSVWVLSLKRSGEELTLLDDQPIVVFNAAQDPRERPSYEVLAPMAFAACLRPEDIDTITAGDYSPGQAVTLDAQALANQLSQAAYHEFSDEFDQEKYGQFVLTIQVKEGDVPVPYHPLDEGAEEIDETASRRLVLSVGQESDTVCLYHQNFGYDRNMTGRQYARSPELYRTICDLFD